MLGASKANMKALSHQVRALEKPGEMKPDVAVELPRT
jgi:hypothetical protein